MAEWLSGDFETRSRVNLKTHGLYRYAQDATTDVWCFSYAFDDEPVQLWEMGQPAPARIVNHVRQGGAFKAWNAQFERVIWNAILAARYNWPKLTIEQTHCTMAQALTHGYPASLDRCADAMGIAGKDKMGHRLMMQMCRPREVAGDTCIWWDDRDRRSRLATYCVQDTEIERTIASRLRPMSPEERVIYILDQQINERGFLVDHELVAAGITMVGHVANNLDEDVAKLTKWKLTTRSVTLLINWLWMHSDLEVHKLDKYTVAALLRRPGLDETTQRVLEIRAEAAKSSLAKLKVMQVAPCLDGRLHATLQYYGAGRTGRWAGRLIQPHNFPKGHLQPDEIEFAVAQVKETEQTLDFDAVDILHGPPLDLMASLLRACVVAAEGKDLLVADFAAIEARVLAWLANERKMIALFAGGGDPYRVMASDVYRVAVDRVNGEQRWLGKQLVLGCGYQQGSVSFRLRLAREGIDVDADFAENAITSYRYANPNITGLWENMQAAAMQAIREPGRVFSNGKIKFGVKGGMLLMKLPSGRYLSYLRPSIGSVTTKAADGSEWTREQIFYWGVSPVNFQWKRNYTYGGKLTENAVQAIARDILAAAMVRVSRANYPIILHVHDEIVAEVPEGKGSIEDFERRMATVPPELEGCPIKVSAWRGKRYRK